MNAQTAADEVRTAIFLHEIGVVNLDEVLATITEARKCLNLPPLSIERLKNFIDHLRRPS